MWGNNIHIDSENINKLKNRYKFVRNQIPNDLMYFLSRVRASKVGQIYVGICPFPFHYEKTASFTIYPKGYINKDGKKQEYTSFYCYGCGTGGDAIKFKQLLDGLDSKLAACKLIEKEFDINIDDANIQKLMLDEELKSIKNTQTQTLSFNDINKICSNICKRYLFWIKDNYPQDMQREFQIVQKFYKYFDEQILECTANDAENLINQTEQIITERRMQIYK